MIIAPDGGDAWAPAKPRPDETVIRALARAHLWKRLLEEGRYGSAGEIADAEKVTRSFVNRLAAADAVPDIAEAILDGRQPKAMQLEELTRAMPSGWVEQRESFASCEAYREATGPLFRKSFLADNLSPAERSGLGLHGREAHSGSRHLPIAACASS